MSLAAGGYIIYPMVNETRDYVFYTPKGNKKANATIFAGPLTDEDNRCYWACTVASMTIEGTSTEVNYLCNQQAGSKGFLAPKTTKTATQPTEGMEIIQKAKDTLLGSWIITQAGTDTVNGITVNVYTIKMANYSWYLTASEDGILTIDQQAPGSDSQKFYFEPTTYLNSKLAFPTAIIDSATNNGYLIYSSTFTPYWYSSAKDTTYQARRRYRQQDSEGTWEDWSDWMAPNTETKTYHGWTNITASLTTTIQKGKSFQFLSDIAWNEPVVDNINYMGAEIETEIRLLVTKSNKTTHGPSKTTLLEVYKQPVVTLSGVIITSDSINITYSNIDYSMFGAEAIVTIRRTNSEGEVLLEKYKASYAESSGSLTISKSDLKGSAPNIGDILYVSVTAGPPLVQQTGTWTGAAVGESNDDASIGDDPEDSQSGSGINAGASLTTNVQIQTTDRLTYLLINDKHTTDSLYIQVPDLNYDGSVDPPNGIHWAKCDIYSEYIEDGIEKIAFEVPGAFNKSTKYQLYITSDNLWASKNGIITINSIQNNPLNTLYYGWYWVDDAGKHQAAILRFQAGSIVKPSDSITNEYEEFVTTGRQYPVYRFGKSTKRDLSVSGIILNDESATYYTKAAFDRLSIAHHAWFRRPDGMVQEVIIDSIKYSREDLYLKIDISQKAETR